MQPPSDFVIEPPDDLTVEGWLVQFDNSPRLIPRWPESRRMTLVACVVEDLQTKAESEAVGYVITKPEQANALVDFEQSLDGVGVLFFTIPKMRVKPHCPGLSDEDWVKTE